MKDEMRGIDAEQGQYLIGIIRPVLFVLIMVAAFRLSSGKSMPTPFLIYSVLVLANQVVLSLCLSKDLIIERNATTGVAGKRDIFYALVMGRLGILLIMITAGLDNRYAWSPIGNEAAGYAGLALCAVGIALTDWAVIVNKFFSSIVRIQTDRDHHVVTAGPYGIIRHPGYAGAILLFVSQPLITGSIASIIPSLLVILIVILRTHDEDRYLRQNLKGYDAYSETTKHRLIPGVW